MQGEHCLGSRRKPPNPAGLQSGSCMRMLPRQQRESSSKQWSPFWTQGLETFCGNSSLNRLGSHYHVPYPPP